MDKNREKEVDEGYYDRRHHYINDNASYYPNDNAMITIPIQ